MPKYVIEREISDVHKMSAEELHDIARKSCAALRELGPDISWVHSYITDEKIYCIFIAANEDLVVEHAQRIGLPINSVFQVRAMLDPTSAEI